MDQAIQLAVQAIKNRLDQLDEASQIETLSCVLDSMPAVVAFESLSGDRYTTDDWKAIGAAEELIAMIKVQANG